MFSVSSCVIGPQGTYYQPSYPDSSAKFEGGECHGTAGSPSVIKFSTEDGSNIKFSLNSGNGGDMLLKILLDVLHDSSAQFASSNIHLTDPKSGKEWTKKAQTIKLLQGPTIPIPASSTINFDEIGPTTPLHVPINISWNDFQVWLPFSITNYHPRAVKVHLPTIVANNKEYEIPPIELVENKKIKERNILKANGKQNPFLWWPYIANERQDGSWSNVDGFIIGGGVTSSYQKGLEDEFSGNIMVAFPPSTKWRFSSNRIRFVDVHTKKEHYVNFENILPRFDLVVSFLAPVLGRGSITKTTAVTNIVVSDKELESLIVRLPELFINGKEIRLKPITFRKKFGVGVIPFNC